ncbi:MAG: cytochrome c oxidase subunit II [bacterium]|nr:cytochrome c oxidase subunit II [bacterium]
MIEYFLEQGSTYAASLDGVVNLIGVLVGFWFMASLGAFLFLIFRFRKKPNQKAQYVTGYEKHEARWVHWPHHLILVCDIFIVIGAVQVWVDIKQTLPEEPEAERVRIISQQWAWTFVHAGPDGKLDTADDIPMIDELHVEVNKPYIYELSSLDVLHDFSVPIFRLKQDSIPGRVITGWFEPTITGEYDIQCAEICGIGHGLMPGRIYIESSQKHAAWQAQQAPIALAATAQ